MYVKQETKVTQNSGMGFLGFLTILFIGLKLTDVIDWSWWWVLSPVWIPFALFIPIALGIFTFLVVKGDK